MIAPLRARHRATFTRLAVILPALFALALATRAPEPTNASLPAPAPDSVPPIATVLRKHVQLHRGSVYSASFGSDPSAVALVQEGGERAPDVLAYWSETEPRDGELASDALLLGPVGERERTYRLPESAHDSGWIVLFSLAYGEVVVSIALGRGAGE